MTARLTLPIFSAGQLARRDGRCGQRPGGRGCAAARPHRGPAAAPLCECRSRAGAGRARGPEPAAALAKLDWPQLGRRMGRSCGGGAAARPRARRLDDSRTCGSLECVAGGRSEVHEFASSSWPRACLRNCKHQTSFPPLFAAKLPGRARARACGRGERRASSRRDLHSAPGERRAGAQAMAGVGVGTILGRERLFGGPAASPRLFGGLLGRELGAGRTPKRELGGPGPGAAWRELALAPKPNLTPFIARRAPQCTRGRSWRTCVRRAAWLARASTCRGTRSPSRRSPCASRRCARNAGPPLACAVVPPAPPARCPRRGPRRGAVRVGVAAAPPPRVPRRRVASRARRFRAPSPGLAPTRPAAGARHKPNFGSRGPKHGSRPQPPPPPSSPALGTGRAGRRRAACGGGRGRRGDGAGHLRAAARPRRCVRPREPKSRLPSPPLARA